LLRLDGGNDSIENIDIVLEHNQSNKSLTPDDFLIKTSRYIKLSFGKGCRSLNAFEAVYKKLAYG